jgi:prepilin-type N-terminal cleavage/methylation domain-containing protein
LLMRRRDLERRAFTLIELMVAIAILVLIAALLVPSTGGVSEGARFQSACDQLSSVASVCRAEARRTGKPVAVVATRDEKGRQSIVSVPLGDAAELSEDATIEVDSRVMMVMPAGYHIEAKSAPAEAAEQDQMEVSVAPEDAEQTQSLIIFWANGGATASGPLVVKGPNGMSAGATVNSWTGALSIGEEPSAEDPKAEEPEPKPDGDDESKPEPAPDSTGEGEPIKDFSVDP